MSYESPIVMFANNVQTDYENGIIKAVQNVGFNVNKEELIKALQYDRGQYEKGFTDGRPKWISVNEKLPKTEDHVLCCTETKQGRKNVVIGYYMDGWRCGMNSNVIAWMPLPEPYRSE